MASQTRNKVKQAKIQLCSTLDFFTTINVLQLLTCFIFVYFKDVYFNVF